MTQPSRDDVLALVRGRRGHFLLESGYHGALWLDLDPLFADPERTEPLAERLAGRLRPHAPEIVCGPLLGGAFLAQLVAGKLGAQFCFTRRDDSVPRGGTFATRYQLPPAFRERVRGRRVAMVDDVMSAGSSLRATHAALLGCGAVPVAAGALLVLGNLGVRYFTGEGIPVESLAREDYQAWPPEQCPECAAGLPIEDPSAPVALDWSDVRRELLGMAEEDDRVRTELAADGSLFQGYHPRMRAVHDAHASRLAAIMADGWPGEPQVGEDGAEAAWRIVQHAIGQPALLRRALVALRAAAARKVVPAWQPAMLEDRIRILEGSSQRYGTQFDWDQSGRLSPLPIEDEAAVDERRKAIGLRPLAEEVEARRRAAAREGERAPKDWPARRREMEAWRREVGWQSPRLPLEILPETLAVCRLPADADVPGWVAGAFLTVSRTPDELSITAPQAAVPADARCERDYRAFRVRGPLPLNLIGVLAAIADPLAAAGLSIFAISTYDTDYVLVKGRDLERAIVALEAAGHEVRGP